MALGAFAAVINVIYFGVIDGKMNKRNVTDTYGAGYIFLISFLGTMFIAPLVIVGMVNNGVRSNLLVNLALTERNSAGWALIYVGISAGVAIVGSLLTGLFIKCLGQ